MKSILRFFKNIWIINFFRRIYRASKYFNNKYIQILKWGFTSNEDTNFTYELTDANIQYFAHTVSVVCGIAYSEVLVYFEELENNQELKQSILTSIKNSKEGRFADNEIRYGRRLVWYAFTRVMKPKIIVETGVDKGLGSILLCSALLKNKEEGSEGRYYGTDINLHAGYYLEGKYKDVGEILYGDSIETLKGFTENIGIFINDSDHSEDYEYEEYLTIEHLLKEDSIILGDNSHCTDKLARFSQKTGRDFVYINEVPKDHWYPGAGVGISYNQISK